MVILIVSIVLYGNLRPINPLVTRTAFSDRFRSNFQGIFKADHQEFHFFKFFLNLIFLMLLNFIKFLVNLMMYF